MGRDNNIFFQIHTEKSYDGLLQLYRPYSASPHYDHIVIMVYQYIRKNAQLEKNSLVTSGTWICIESQGKEQCKDS